jgi:hypothetical protein
MGGYAASRRSACFRGQMGFKGQATARRTPRRLDKYKARLVACKQVQVLDYDLLLLRLLSGPALSTSRTSWRLMIHSATPWTLTQP